MSYGEVESHFSTIKVTGEARVQGNDRYLEHGDVVFVVQRAEISKLAFPREKSTGLITRQQIGKAEKEDTIVICEEDWDEFVAKYRPEPTGPMDEALAEISDKQDALSNQ
jgi:hypothetical protein